MFSTIIIVNWNSAHQLVEVVQSISNYHSNLVQQVVIVDNASTDDSIQKVIELNDLAVKINIISNSRNMGFGFACNQGAALASTDFLLFLNPDTVLFENSLSAPISFMQKEENASVGVVGIQLIDENDNISRSCAKFPRAMDFFAQAIGLNRIPGFTDLSLHMGNWTHDSTREVDHVIGAFYLIRRNLFESLNGFDERFYVYLEDLDLSLRVSQAGYRSVYFADVQAFHAGGGVSKQVKAHRLFYSLRSRLLYGFKNYRRINAWFLFLITLTIEPVTRSFFSFISDGHKGVRITWQAYKMLFDDLSTVLKRRSR